MHRKLENPQSEISYSVVVPSGDAEKNLNTVAQLQTIAYIKPPKTFQKFALLNIILVSTTGGTAVHFWYNLYELDNFS